MTSQLTRSRYSGDLTFIINDELEIMIPNSQLVQPDVSIDSSGVTTVPSMEASDK